LWPIRTNYFESYEPERLSVPVYMTHIYRPAGRPVAELLNDFMEDFAQAHQPGNTALARRTQDVGTATGGK
jgi:hypothetical protein